MGYQTEKVVVFALSLFYLGLPGAISTCDIPAFNNTKLFDALRKAESNGNTCKINGGALGPYQISEQYYNDSGIGDFGKGWQYVWGKSSQNYSEMIIKSYVCKHRPNNSRTLTPISVALIHKFGTVKQSSIERVNFRLQIRSLISKDVILFNDSSSKTCEPECDVGQCCEEGKCMCLDTTTLEVKECKVLIVEFESSQFTGDESSQSVQVVITKSNVLSNAIIIVQIALSEHPSMPATGSGVDFDSRPININIAPNDIRIVVTIPVMCDRLIEGTEMFDISLRLILVSHNVTVQLGRNRSVGVIKDSTVHARFEHSTYSIREDLISLSPVIILSQPSLQSLTLAINLMDISTSGATDCNQQSISVIIAPNTVMHRFTINITNENVVECNETFSMSISTEGTWCGLNNDNSRAQVTVINDDVGVVNILQPPLLVKESAGSLVIGLSLNTTASEDITILTTIAGVTASVGSDFSHTGVLTQLTSSVTIVSGSLSGSVRINILDDTVQEYNETFNVTLQLQPDFSCRHLPITLNGENSFTVTIIDDEELTVEFSQATYNGREDSEHISVTLNLLGGTAMYDFSVNVSTSPISATGGIDYDNTTLTTTFIAGTTVATVSIPIVDDTVVDENPEAFTLSFYLIPMTGVRVDSGSYSTATGIILDTTPPQIHVHPMDETVSISNDSLNIDFTCMAYGSRTYMWEREIGDIPSNARGINSSHLILYKILPPLSGLYRCLATNDHGTTPSRYANLTVKALPPVVSVVAVGETELKEGERAEFTCLATGVGANNFKYQWFWNNQPIDDEDAQTLVVISVSEDNTGNYTCSVLNPYEVIGRSNNTITLVLERFCNPVTVSYHGFNITWNETKVGVTVEAPCTGPGLKGIVSRRCIIDDDWDETVNCFREHTLLNVTSLTNSSQNPIFNFTGLEYFLANLTDTKPMSCVHNGLPIDIDISSLLNNITDPLLILKENKTSGEEPIEPVFPDIINGN